MDVTKREVYLLGPNIHYGYNYDWHGDYYYPVMRTTFAPESLFVGSMYTALIGADEKLVDELDDFMDMDYGGPFSKKNRKKYSLTSKLLLWRRTRQMPMAEQVVQKRMDEKERKLAVESKEKRNKEFEELTVNGNIIHTGRYAGKLLVDELMKDLMEAAATA